jgi:hypothetical protein
MLFYYLAAPANPPYHPLDQAPATERGCRLVRVAHLLVNGDTPSFVLFSGLGISGMVGVNRAAGPRRSYHASSDQIQSDCRCGDACCLTSSRPFICGSAITRLDEWPLIYRLLTRRHIRICPKVDLALSGLGAVAIRPMPYDHANGVGGRGEAVTKDVEAAYSRVTHEARPAMSAAKPTRGSDFWGLPVGRSSSTRCHYTQCRGGERALYHMLYQHAMRIHRDAFAKTAVWQKAPLDEIAVAFPHRVRKICTGFGFVECGCQSGLRRMSLAGVCLARRHDQSSSRVIRLETGIPTANLAFLYITTGTNQRRGGCAAIRALGDGAQGRFSAPAPKR